MKGKSRMDIELEDIKLEEVKPFFDSLTAEETEYFGVSVEQILNTSAYIKGMRVDNKLAGIGGLRKSRGSLLFSFYMVKSEFQRRGIGNKFTEAFVQFAREKRRSFFLATVAKGNTAMIVMTQRQGYKIVYEADDTYWMFLPVTKRGQIIARFVPPLLRILFSPIGKPFRFISQSLVRIKEQRK